MRPALLCILGLLVGGCASQRTVGLPTVHASDVRVRLDESARPMPPRVADLGDDIGGPWRVITGEQDLFAEPRDPLVDEVLVAEAPLRPQPRPQHVVRASKPRSPIVALPRRRAAKPARPEGKKLQRSPAQLAREHFLDFPTYLRAQKVTFYCPAAYAAEVRLRGAAVDDLGGGSRRAQGRARLVLRELTLEARRITFKVRTDGESDLQVMARGDVQVVSDVRGQVTREDGLRSLLITNDRMVPLR